MIASPLRCRPAAVVSALVSCAIIGALPGRAAAEIGDAAADTVIGQSALTDAIALPLSASSFARPRGVAIDRSVTPNRVFVSDSTYHRVLGWSDVDALANGAPADIVIGQPDFAAFGCNRHSYFDGVPTGASLSTLCQPAGLGVDANGRLYVADAGNCRVLAYDDPFGTDQIADQVIGQPDGTTSTCTGTASATNLYQPFGVAVNAANDVFIADMLHCRVIELDDPATTDTTFDRVYGQTSLTASSCSGPGNLYFPTSVTLDPSGNLWVGSSSRVYEIDDPLGPDHGIDRTLGDAQCNDGGETASSTCGPIAVASDAAGRLYVGDAGNNRVLEYDTPLVLAQASRVFGQPGFNGGSTLFVDECNNGGADAGSLCLRQVQVFDDGSGTYDQDAALDVDDAGRLYVADGLNHRVLRYDAPAASDAVADLVLGHDTMTDVRKPVAVIDEPHVAVGRSFEVVVADPGTSRVLIYASWGSYPDMPQGVIGQPSMSASGCNTGGISASSLCTPRAVSVDFAGNLWVADSGNNRVLEYDYPWFQYNTTTRQYEVRSAADRVEGQPTFDSSACGSGASGLCDPRGVAADLHGNLYVADSGNNRVAQNQNPLADATFERAFGQTSLAGSACNDGGVSATSLCDPREIALGTDDTLFVADAGNHRVLAYLSAFNGDTQADRVFGQGGSMSAADAGGGAGGLSSPAGVGLDDSGNLYVADTGNDRVLEIDAPLTGDLLADRVFGQPDLSATGCNAGGVSATSLCGPVSVAIDGSYYDKLFVGDAGNQRVLRYDAPFCRGDFTLTAANRHDKSARSKPTATSLKIKNGPGAGDDLLTFKGTVVLLEQDGGISLSDSPLLTFSSGGATVFQQRVPYLHNLRATAKGGIWDTEYLKGEIPTGIDAFNVHEGFVIPGNDAKPQFDRLKYKGRAVGLELGGFTASSASFRLQFGSVCFTTALTCKGSGSSRSCSPSR